MERFGAPNFLSLIDAYEQGSRRAERGRLQELAERGRQLSGEVLAGNNGKLAELYSVDPERGMQVQQFTQSQKQQFVKDFAAAAYDAKTPEQWNAVVNRFKQQGHTFGPGEDLFENRDSMINQVIDIGDRMGMDLRREEAKRDQANADRNYKLEVDKLGTASPDLVELYDDKTGQPYKAKYNPQTGGFDRIGGVKAPNGTQLEVGPDGSVSFTQGIGKPPNEGQGKDISYLNRMLTAAPILDRNDEALTSLGESVAGNAPLVGNYMKSSQFQQAEQAGRNFLTALLRKESGAQIPPAEERSYAEIFLPRPGDKKEVIAQKREARRQAAIGIRMGLPAHLIKGMIQQGVDFSTLDAAPNGSAGGNNQGQGGQGGKSNLGSGTTGSGNQFRLVQ